MAEKLHARLEALRWQAKDDFFCKSSQVNNLNSWLQNKERYDSVTIMASFLISFSYFRKGTIPLLFSNVMAFEKKDLLDFTQKSANLSYGKDEFKIYSCSWGVLA